MTAAITDDQIAALAERVNEAPTTLPSPPPGVSVSSWHLAIATDCAVALGPFSPILSDDANYQLREQARARCADVLGRLRDPT